MSDPSRRVMYTSQIVDAGDRPQFVVTAADDPMNPIVSYSPSGAWKTVLRRVMTKTGGDCSNICVSGALRFGIAHPAVVQILKELPNGDKCIELVFSLLDDPDKKISFASDDESDGVEDQELLMNDKGKNGRNFREISILKLIYRSN